MGGRNRLVGASSQLDEVRRGSHVCWVVESTTSFEPAAVDFLAAGADHGEKPFWLAPESALPSLPIDRSVTRTDPSVSVLGGEPLDSDAIFAMFRRETAVARQQGYSGMRVLADMDWLFGSLAQPSDLTRFELLLDEVVAELEATIVCAYRTISFPGATVGEMAAVHPVTVGEPPSEPGFRIWSLGTDPAAPGWGLSGEIDLLNAELFGRVLTGAAEGRPLLRLHAGGLWFVAVAGINAVLRLAHTQPQLRVVFVDSSPMLRRSWTLLELHRQLPQVEFSPLGASDVATPTAATAPEVA